MGSLGPTMGSRIRGAMLGLVVGDALGVPVEFRPRSERRNDPVIGMRGHGTHNQPAGTWSDDGSLALITAECLLGGYDPDAIMEGFRRWLQEAYWTAHGRVFDVGRATGDAIARYAEWKRSGSKRGEGDEWGGTEEFSNGNGSLMRIMPLSLFAHRMETPMVIARSFEISGLTHAHIRSNLCCAYFSLLVQALLQEVDLTDAMQHASRALTPAVPPEEAPNLSRILSGQILLAPESAVRSDGYVVHTLEAGLWCCHQFAEFREAVLGAVNLGDDTDTTGAVTGALAGLIHGEESILKEWVDALAGKEKIVDLVGRFAAHLLRE